MDCEKLLNIDLKALSDLVNDMQFHGVVLAIYNIANNGFGQAALHGQLILGHTAFTQQFPQPPANRLSFSFMRSSPVSFPLGFVRVQSCEKFIVGAVIDFPQFYQNAGTDVQFTSFVLGIGGAANVASPPLQFRAQFLL